MHEANFLHGDIISMDSFFFVLKNGDELYSLLGNLGISKNMEKSTGNVAVQKRVAPEQKHPVTPVEGFCNDIFYVGLSLGLNTPPLGYRKSLSHTVYYSICINIMSIGLAVSG